jgi:hypothetical protein
VNHQKKKKNDDVPVRSNRRSVIFIILAFVTAVILARVFTDPGADYIYVYIGQRFFIPHANPIRFVASAHMLSHALFALSTLIGLRQNWLNMHSKARALFGLSITPTLLLLVYYVVQFLAFQSGSLINTVLDYSAGRFVIEALMMAGGPMSLFLLWWFSSASDQAEKAKHDASQDDEESDDIRRAAKLGLGQETGSRVSGTENEEDGATNAHIPPAHRG